MMSAETQPITCPHCGRPPSRGRGDSAYCSHCSLLFALSTETETQTPEVWGPGEITRNLGVSRATMKRWRDAGGFPEPYQELSIGPVWLAEDVKRWDEGRKGSA